MSSKLKILVAGGAGYIGSHTVLSLLENGFEVVVLDDLTSGSREAVPDTVPFIEGNIANSELIDKVCQKYNIKAALHFAGNIIVPESISNPLGYYENNVSNSISFFKSLLRNGVKNTIFSSTAAIYGVAENKFSVKEDSFISPLSPYGRTKLMIEWVLHDLAHAYDFNYTVLRYFNVAGADLQGRTGQRSKQTTHLIKTVCEVILGKRDELVIFGDDYNTPDGTCIRDYIHVSDLANAHTKALTFMLDKKRSEIFNCGYGCGNSIFDIISSAERVAGISLKTKVGPRRVGDLPALIADSSKIKSMLNWEPLYNDLDLIIQSALEWEKRQDQF